MSKVGIIGAGPAGLATAKACLEEGLTPVVFEASSAVGGLWRGARDSHAWEGMRTNLSKWSCMFSDFPWPVSETDIFPTQAKVCAYLGAYAAHFGVTGHIQFQTPVLNASPSADGWMMTTMDGMTGCRQEAQVDYLIVASGFFSKGDVPAIPGKEDFDGRILHSSHFHNPALSQKNCTAVIGGSFSGCEIAVELARQGIPVTHILRNPVWIVSRLTPADQVPLDLLFYNRKPALALSATERNRLSAHFLQSTYGNPGDTHPALRIDPDSGNENFVAVCDDYLNLVRAGKIKIQRGSPVRCGRFHIELDTNEKIAAERIIFATGFSSSLDFFSPDIKEQLHFNGSDKLMPLPLHQATFPELAKLGFAGYYRGPYLGVMELQGRWLAGVISGTLPHPDPEKVREGVADAMQLGRILPHPQFPYGDYIPFCDAFAKAIGALPPQALQTSPVIPSQYRLSGRHANPAVAQQIIDSLPAPGGVR